VKHPVVNVAAIKISASTTKNKSLTPKRCKARSKALASVDAFGAVACTSNNHDHDDENCAIPVQAESKMPTSIPFAIQILTLSNPNHQCQGTHTTQFPSLMPELYGSKVFDVEEISDSIPFRPWPMAHSLHMKENTKKDALTKNTKQQSKLVKKKVKLTSKAKPFSKCRTIVKAMDSANSDRLHEESMRRSQRRPVLTDRYSPEATCVKSIKETKPCLTDGKEKSEAICLVKQEIPVKSKRSRRSAGSSTNESVEEDVPNAVSLPSRRSKNRVVEENDKKLMVVKQTCQSDGTSNSSKARKRLAKETIPVVAKRTRLSREGADTHKTLAIMKEDEKKERSCTVRKVKSHTNLTELEKFLQSRPVRRSIEKSKNVAKYPRASKQVTRDTIHIVEPAEPNQEYKIEKSSLIGASITEGGMETVPMDLSWTCEQINSLREAQISTDPRSSSFWSSVASKVDGKTDAECRAKWFSLVNTPAPKRLRPVQNLPSVGKQDDLFYATPMRGVPSSHAADVVVNFDVGSPILDTRTANRQLLTEYGDERSTIGVTKKVGYKTYLQGLRRGVAKGERERKAYVPKRQSQPKQPQKISERVESGAIEMNCQLTPGGTLMVKTFAEDDFFDDINSDDSGDEL
jgi:hypothetical protein